MYTLFQKGCHFNHGCILSILDRFAKFFGFCKKPQISDAIHISLPTTSYVCFCITFGNLEIENFAVFVHVSNVHVKHLSNVTSSIQQISVKYHENTCKYQQYAKYRHFTFCSFTVLSKLTVLQLSNVGLSTIQHQHSKISHHKQKTLEPKHIKMPIVCISLLKICSKCPPFARKHALRRFLHWSIAISIMSCPKSDHNASTNVRYSLLDHK